MSGQGRLKSLLWAPPTALLYLLCALPVNAASRALFGLLGLPCAQQTTVSGWEAMDAGARTWALVLALLISPPLEEILFRWLLPKGLGRLRLTRPWAEAAAALLFAAVHRLPWAIPMLTLFALAQSHCLRRFGLPFVILVHACFNALQMLLLVLLHAFYA